MGSTTQKWPDLAKTRQSWQQYESLIRVGISPNRRVRASDISAPVIGTHSSAGWNSSLTDRVGGDKLIRQRGRHFIQLKVFVVNGLNLNLWYTVIGTKLGVAVL